jgi:rubrerythrin
MSDVLEVLKKGMSTEIWGQRFYKEAVARTQSEDGKKVFQSLVDEEGKHLDILRGQYAAVSGNSQWVSVEEALKMAASVNPTDIFPEASSAQSLIPADASDEQSLQLAMDFERRGYEMYQKAAAEATSAEAKSMWAWLAKAEDMHFAFLQETREYLANNGVWYFDENELPFFEG